MTTIPFVAERRTLRADERKTKSSKLRRLQKEELLNGSTKEAAGLHFHLGGANELVSGRRERPDDTGQRPVTAGGHFVLDQAQVADL